MHSYWARTFQTHLLNLIQHVYFIAFASKMLFLRVNLWNMDNNHQCIQNCEYWICVASLHDIAVARACSSNFRANTEMPVQSTKYRELAKIHSKRWCSFVQLTMLFLQVTVKAGHRTKAGCTVFTKVWLFTRMDASMLLHAEKYRQFISI